MSFAKAIQNEPDTRTTNGMKSYTTTKSANVDLFYKIGASRGKDITATFAKAYAEDRVKALRILFWARDIRQGAGERQLLAPTRPDIAYATKDLARDLQSPPTQSWNKLRHLGRY